MPENKLGYTLWRVKAWRLRNFVVRRECSRTPPCLIVCHAAENLARTHARLAAGHPCPSRTVRVATSTGNRQRVLDDGKNCRQKRWRRHARFSGVRPRCRAGGRDCSAAANRDNGLLAGLRRQGRAGAISRAPARADAPPTGTRKRCQSGGLQPRLSERERLGAKSRGASANSKHRNSARFHCIGS